ncbi:Flp family type IVb pilin [Rosenbergiella epipactidis]|uniref:Flp family type IVb pilin n=1 Tax=Rosenbergiella epipactidis TaxID=1544694 RepID=UPI001F4DECF4|nr:Flp family type IVb pilin [Rosenbergiella epipactidis]MCL9667367.1 Flp family type IVb pilin [Rosenbergiella epipactidis]
MKDTMMYGVVYSQNFFSQTVKQLKSKLSKEDGVTAIEYAVIAVAISAMLLAVFGNGSSSFITAITDKFQTLSNNIKGTIK